MILKNSPVKWDGYYGVSGLISVENKSFINSLPLIVAISNNSKPFKIILYWDIIPTSAHFNVSRNIILFYFPQDIKFPYFLIW